MGWGDGVGGEVIMGDGGKEGNVRHDLPCKK